MDELLELYKTLNLRIVIEEDADYPCAMILAGQNNTVYVVFSTYDPNYIAKLRNIKERIDEKLAKKS